MTCPALANLQLLADAFAPSAAGPREAAGHLETEVRRLRGWVPDAEVARDDLRWLVSVAAEARAGLAASERLTHDHLADVVRARVARAFERLPESAVAVNRDGSYLTEPGGSGVPGNMGSPLLLDAAGGSLGEVVLGGVRAGIDEVSVAEISGPAGVPGVTDLGMWYEAARTAVPRFAGGPGRTGDSATIMRLAGAAAERAGWILRPPVVGTPTRSGFYIPDSRLPADDREAVIAEAELLPPLAGAVALYVLFQDGLFVVDGRWLTPREFQRDVIDRLGIERNLALILFAAGTADPAQVPNAAAVLAALSDRFGDCTEGRPVLDFNSGELVTARALAPASQVLSGSCTGRTAPR